MNDYVIINGVNSNTISGLKISKLPPITKPQMRTLIEAIDGRDGDLITDLGYSAYDKQLEIGLWGTYDINEIISFFNQSGTITFSNEADKFYNFKIVNQIDYQKLLKFKTAVVVMHCQPFKYPTNETPIEGTPTTITGEGESLTLNNTLEAPLEIDLKGNTYQNGEPTPDTPIDIQVVSGDNTIKVEGKNLLPIENVNKTISTVNIYSLNGNLYLNGTNSTPIYSTEKLFTFILPAGTYTTSQSETGTPNLFLRKTSDDTTINESNRTFTLSEDTSVYACSYIKANTYSNYQLLWYIVKGTQPSTYTPYVSQTYPINLGSIELCKIGDYQDRIYKDNGKWYLHKEIGKVVLDGSETNWSLTTGTNKYSFWFRNNSIGALTQRHKKYCDNFTYSNSGYTYVGTPYLCENDAQENPSNFMFIFNTDGTQGTTIAQWKTWLSTHNTTVYYVVNTPTNEEITDSTLIEQLNALEGANSYDNQTNINQTNNDYPFWLSASTTFNAPITINNIGNIYAKPILELEGSGNITINLNSQDILAISLGDTTTKIVLDIPNLEAYNPTDSTLMNRLVVGDYMKFLINSGNNTLKIDGNITSYRLTSYTRWL